MINMIESRVMEHVWRQWEPHIIYVFHQTAPFPTRIWLPPFSEPVGLDAPPIVSREVNMIGMAIAQGLDERGQVGATHMGTVVRRLVPGLRRLRAGLQEHPGVLDRDGGQHGGAARVHRQRLPAGLPRPAAAEPLLEPVAGRLVAPRRRRRLQRDGGASRRSSTRRSTRSRCSTTATRRAATRSRAGRTDGAVRLRHPAGAARPGGGRRDCCAASRSAACACRSSPRRSTIDGVHVPGRHVGRADRPGIRRDGARGARRAEVPGPAPVPGRPAAAAVRRRRLDAAAADGRAASATRRRRSPTTCARR